MPTETWWNLPEEKRERITDVAMAEFGSKGFSAGSLNAVAREAGIAKGSLFQYFDDKLDLFATVCEAGSARIEEAALRGVDLDQPLFDLLRDIVGRWLAYFRTHPREREMAFATANEVDAQARAAVRGVANEHYAKALGPMVELARGRGELRHDVDAELVVSMVALVLRHLNTAPFFPHGDPAIPMSELGDAQVDRIARSYIDALEGAFGDRSPGAD
jgi:AcrR family transcriptional regulator